MKNPENEKEIKEFCSKNKLKVKEVIFTNGKKTFSYIKNLKSSHHFDDFDKNSLSEIKNLEHNNIKVTNCFNKKKWEEYKETAYKK